VRRLAVLFVMLLWGLSKRPVFGQTPTPAIGEGTSLQLGSSLVIVPALVQTRAGGLVFTIYPIDFVITDNGVAQKITMDDETGRQPIALVVVMEMGGTGACEFDNDGYLPLYKMQEALVGAVPHKVAVVCFDSQGGNPSH